MSRAVTALFDTRSEAEVARARLLSEVKVEATRLLAKDTAAAVHGLKLHPNVAKQYREALLQGCHLLVARVARGEEAKRIIEVLGQSTAADTDQVDVNQSYEIGTYQAGGASQPDGPLADVTVPDKAASGNDVIDADAPNPNPKAKATETTANTGRSAANGAATEASDAPPQKTKSEAPDPLPDEIRIGQGQVIARGSVASKSLEEPAQSEASLNSEDTGSDDHEGVRHLTYDEVEAAGLLKDRTIEVVEMREEPVVAKEVVVREEVIIRKTVNQRTETISDVVRRNQVEVDELPSSEGR